MLYREITAVCSEIHTKHINTLCGQNVEFVNVKPGGTYSKEDTKGLTFHYLLTRSTLYVWRYIVASSPKHCCTGNETMHSLYIFKLHVTDNMKILSVAQRCHVAGNAEPYCGLPVKCLIFLSVCNKICISRQFRRCPNIHFPGNPSTGSGYDTSR
jgi:hypothetical protein